jgi:hypothetical protein
MANIETAVVVSFSNNFVRQIADQLEQLFSSLQGFQAAYSGQGIAAAINAAGAGNLIDDGSVAGGSYPGQAANGDGRANVTGTQIENLSAAIAQMLTALNTTLVSGVGTTVKAIADGIQVNGIPR